MADRIFSAFSAAQELQPAPIHPAWIVEGAPVARNCVLAHASDKTGWTMLWDCSAGKFNWIYSVDETVHILEGQVHVRANGFSRTLMPGDTAFFPAGVTAQWHVESYVRKVAFCHRPLPAPLALTLRLSRRLLTHLHKGVALVKSSLAEPVTPEAPRKTVPQDAPTGRAPLKSF